MEVEEVIELLGKGDGAVRILDTGSTNDRLKELTLKYDFRERMNVVRLDTKALVELLEVFFLLFLITAARVIVALFCSLDWSLPVL